MQDVKLGIGVPLSHNSVPVDFFESFIAMRKPKKHLFFRASSYQGLAAMRNQLVEAAQINECTHLLFLDVDHKHNPETIVRLLSYDLPIVSGLSFMRLPPFSPCAFSGEINSYKCIENIPENSLIEVDTVGAACLLINIDVFNNIKQPYFAFMKNPDPTIPFAIGEDVYFCNSVKDAGYKIYVDTGLETGHIGMVNCDRALWEKWNA